MATVDRDGELLSESPDGSLKALETEQVLGTPEQSNDEASEGDSESDSGSEEEDSTDIESEGSDGQDTASQIAGNHGTEPTPVHSSPDKLSLTESLGSRRDPSETGSYSSEVEEEDADSDAEEEEDDEPALKYERVAGSAQELLEKDNTSALAVSLRLMALGTHNGVVHVLDFHGNKVKSYRPHSASINDICIDSAGEFIATASVDGRVVIHALTSPEAYAFDFRRQMRTVSLEPSFSKSSSRAFICGGMAGNLELHEKSWLGHKETILHSGEGPIWTSSWRGSLIVWANDNGVKIYDTTSRQRISFIDRPPDSPRADLFQCVLQWRDDTTLLIAWADYIKLVRIRPRPAASSGLPYQVEITAVFQVDCMISGIAPYASPPGSFLLLAYIAPDKFVNEATTNRAEQRRKAAHRPELRIISRSGEELSSDVLSLSGYDMFGCNDYVLRPAFVGDQEGTLEGFYVVSSPRSVVIVKPRDEVDHVEWLVENAKYAEALSEMKRLEKTGLLRGLDAAKIGRKYLKHLVEEGDFRKAAELCPGVLGQDTKLWEEEVFTFHRHHQLPIIIPYVPTSSPQLDRVVYEVILAYFLAHDHEALLRTIKEWPSGIYNILAILVAVQSELERAPSSPVLMDCVAELYVLNRQPTLALPYLLRRRRANVFDFIRDNNLFTAVRDQVLLLVDFDQDLEKQRRHETREAEPVDEKGKPKLRSNSITLLVDHIHSIPMARVIQQLQSRPYYLYLYLDAIFDKDPQLASEFADEQVPLYAEFAPTRLMDFLRASNYYSLEKAYKICSRQDMVPEMVFLLGKMGDNKRALNLIIERLGDVHRAIDFAKEQNDDDLWEDLLRYSETRPAFIRGLLENVGAEIDPIRLIRRIKNGLEIPGLKEALMKILWDFNLQISLLAGCQTILNGDGANLAGFLQSRQTSGFLGNPARICPVCNLLLFPDPNSSTLLHANMQPSVALLFLCRHVVHAHCVKGGDSLPRRADENVFNFLNDTRTRPMGGIMGDTIGSKIAYATMIRARLEESCPVCEHKRAHGIT